MVPVQSSKLCLPPSLPQTTSILFEPNSNSLALMHSDSSISLFPSFSFPSSSPSSPPIRAQTLIPSPSSSSSFLLLRDHQKSDPTILFLAAGPHMGGSQILFRFYILQRNNLFTRAQVVCNQKGLGFDSKLGALVDVNHGVSIKIVGSVNFFVMYSVSSKKVWVFAVKLIDDGDSDVVKLMRCTVIECCVPVWSMSVSFGFLILGEDNGVRVFNLRQLLKGKAKKVKSLNSSGNLDLNQKFEAKGLRLPNGVFGNDNLGRLTLETASNDALDGKSDKHCFSVKEKSVRCRQDSFEGGECHVAFKSKEVKGLKATTVKAISIQELSPRKFIILDSNGDVHVLRISKIFGRSEILSQMTQLPHSMKVQKLAVLPDVASGSNTQIFWVSDGFHSVHVLNVCDIDDGVDKKEDDENWEKLTDTSVVKAIFTGEKVKDLKPLAASSILILGQGTLYAYAIS